MRGWKGHYGFAERKDSPRKCDGHHGQKRFYFLMSRSSGWAAVCFMGYRTGVKGRFRGQGRE